VSRFKFFLPGSHSDPTGRPPTHLTAADWLKQIRRRRLQRTVRAPDVCTVWDDSKITVALSDEFSWRDLPSVVGRVRAQVACGSCWAFGAAEAIETQIGLRRGEYRAISTNQIINCMWNYGNGGCQGGEVHWAISHLLAYPGSAGGTHPSTVLQGLFTRVTTYHTGRMRSRRRYTHLGHWQWR
jgi:hypothetical protein